MNESTKQGSIPKIIHYCWFGKKDMPEMAKHCIASWKKYLPDYKIQEWNEQNFDVNCCDYVKEAYVAKKWAFVSDYARFWILYNYGGLYFDTDVEVIKSFEDIIEKGPFMGCEPVGMGAGKMSQKKVNCAPGLGLGVNPGLGLGVNPGLGLGVNPGLGLYREILTYYEGIHFNGDDKNSHILTVVDHVTSILSKYGWNDNNEIQTIRNITIYPTDYFCPMNYYTGKIILTENTHSIHHYTASWHSNQEKKQMQVLYKLCDLFGTMFAYKIWRLYTLPYRVNNKLKELGFRGTLLFIVNKFNIKRDI